MFVGEFPVKILSVVEMRKGTFIYLFIHSLNKQFSTQGPHWVQCATIGQGQRRFFKEVWFSCGVLSHSGLALTEL